MRRPRLVPFPFAAGMLLLLAAGCYGPRSAGAGDDATPRSSGKRLVLGPEVLFRENGTVLSAMATHFPTVRVIQDSGCPRVIIRGARRLQGSSDPQVYLNGQPALDTCLLGMLRASDLELVEVYPLGVTSRPGYHSHSFGLILLFSRQADDASADAAPGATAGEGAMQSGPPISRGAAKWSGTEPN